MQVTALRYFHEVARLGSIRQAADELRVASSAVSRQIQKLEQELRAPLFERHARGVRLTEAGEIFARHARETLLDLERVQSELDALRGLRRGNVSVWTVEGMIADFMPRVLHTFHGLYPGVTYRVYVGGTDAVVGAVLDDQADIGLAYNLGHHPGILTPIGLRQSLMAVMAPQHPLATRARLTLAEACDHAVAFPAENFGIRHLLDQTLHGIRKEVTPTLVTDSIEMLKSFARFGSGVTFLPQFTVSRELEAKELVCVPLTDPILSRSRVDIVVRRERRLPVAAEALLEEMKRLLGEWPE